MSRPDPLDTIRGILKVYPSLKQKRAEECDPVKLTDAVLRIFSPLNTYAEPI